MPNYHDSIEKKLVDPVGLAVELSSAEPFVGGALAADNFCGEALGVAKLGDGNLYSIGDIFSDPKLSKDRYLYLILVDLKERPALDRSYWPKFDLRTDAREICVQTVYRGRFFAGHSNIVRVQRSLIEKALKEGVKPLPIKLSRGL